MACLGWCRLRRKGVGNHPPFIGGWIILILLMATRAWPVPQVTAATVTVPTGAQAWVPLILTGQDAGSPVCSIRFRIQVEGGRVVAAMAGPTAEQAGKGVACRVVSRDACLCVVYGGPDGLPEGGDLVRVLVAPESASCRITVGNLEGAGVDATEKAVDPGPPTTPQAGGTFTPHKADRNGDWKISLSELLRIIQFYNLGEYSCRPGTEDGYWPESGDRSCPPHDADYAPQDWRITLNEVLRLVQFFNLGGYGRREGTEDGFMAGGFWTE